MQGAVVGEATVGTVALGVEQDGAELESGVVGNAKLPVGAQPCRAGIGQIAVDDFEEIGDLLSTRLIGAKPPILMPMLQAHRRCR